MMMNLDIAIQHLRLLHEAPDLIGIGIDDDNHRLTRGTISPDQQTLLFTIINNTFAFAEQREALGLPPLRLLVSLSNQTFEYHSAGVIFSLLRPPQGMEFEPKKLALNTEEHAVITIQCCNATIEADCEVLKQASLFFKNLSDSPFVEAQTLTVSLNYSPQTIQLIINFFHGEDLPAVDKNITELLAVAAFLCSDRLDHALTQQLLHADHLDDESWRILFEIHPTLFYPLLVSRRDEFLKVLLIESPDAPQQTPPSYPGTSSPLEDLLAKIIKNKIISTHYLVYLACLLVKQDKKLTPDAQMFFVNLINSRALPLANFCIYSDWMPGEDKERVTSLFAPDFFAKIEVLNLEHSSLTPDTALSLILKCPSVLELILPNTVSGKFLNCLQHTPNLRHLDISQCTNLDPDWLENMQYIPHIQRILYNDQSIFKISPDSYSALCKFSSRSIRKVLKILMVRPTPPSDATVDAVEEEAHFEAFLFRLINDGTVSIGRLLTIANQIVSSGKRLNLRIQHFFITLINRDQLSFTSLCAALGGVEEVHLLFSHAMFRKLTKLHLKTSGFNKHQVTLLLAKCPNLLELSLPDTVSGTLLCYLHYTQQLRSLDLSRCNLLEAKALENLYHTPKLERLNIGNCNQFDFKGLKLPPKVHLIFTI